MEDLRIALLKDTNPKNIEVLIRNFKKHVIYDEFCDFYGMSEILHIEIADSVRKFVIEFILRFRRENLRPYDEKIELDIPGREQLVIDILEENLDAFDDLLDDEKIHLLLFLARIMKVMCFNDRRGVPWAELRFLMCIYVATKTDKHHVKYPLIDFMFQFLIDEELIVNNLRNLIETLKNGSKNDKWLKELRSIYRRTRYYYELQKIYHHLGYLPDPNDYWQNELILTRHFQQIAESLKVIEKLGISKINKDNAPPLFNLYSIPKMIKSFIGMRNPLSHAKTKKGDIANDRFGLVLGIAFVKLDIVVYDLIREEQTSIWDTFISKLVTETDSTRILTEIDRIDIHLINNWDYKYTENGKMKWLSDLIRDQISSAEKYIELNKSFNQLHFGDFNNFTLFFFRSLKYLVVNEIKEKLKYFKDFTERTLTISEIKLFSKEFLKMDFFLKQIPIIAETLFLAKIILTFCFNETKFVEEVANKSDANKIEKVLKIIKFAIENLDERRQFVDFTNNLLLKRQLYNDYQLFGDPSYIRRKWPINDETISWNDNKITYEDPLEIIILKTKENLPDFKLVEQFLDKIDLDHKTEIVEKAKHLELIKLKNRLLTIKRELGENKDDHFAKEMAVLDGFEISRLMGRDLPMEPNYMDYHCLLPTGRPLRNFLAHGDIYLDLFLTLADKQTIIDQQLEEIIDQMDEENQLNPIVSRKEDLSYLKERFNRQKSWIKMYIAPLKLNVEDRFPPGNMMAEIDFVVAMKTRDVHGWTYVHHSLEKCDRNNKFFMYMVNKLTSKTENCNVIFDQMMKWSKFPQERYLIPKIDLERMCCTVRDYLISDFINKRNAGEKRYLLCLILSIDCQEMELFELLFQGTKGHSCVYFELACFYKQTEIVKYLIDNQHVTDKSKLTDGLCYTVCSNNVQSAKYLLEKCAALYKTVALDNALLRANIDMIKLLVEHGAVLDFSLLPKYVFSLPYITEYLVEHYPGLILYDNSLLLFLACYWRSERLVRILTEKGANLNAQQKRIHILTYVCLFFDDFKLLEYLVEKGAIIECDTNPNPLTAACFNTNIKIAKYLIEKGADPTIDSAGSEYQINVDGTRRFGDGSSLDYSIENQSYKLTEELFKKEAKINEYTVGEHIKMIKPSFFNYLTTKDSNINWMIKSLNVVISNNNVKLLKEMLNYLKIRKHCLHAENIKSSFHSKQILYLLLEYPYHEISVPEWSELLEYSLYVLEVQEMKVIIECGADINYKYGSNMFTLLHLFFKYEFFDSAKLRLILRSGADLKAKTKDQVTPVQLAAHKLDEITFQKVLKIILETRDICVQLHLPLQD